MTGFEGGCLCRQVRYRVASEPIAALACHCRDCQYVSGGAEANVVVVPMAALQKSGTEQVYRSTANSATAVRRVFCPTWRIQGLNQPKDTIPCEKGIIEPWAGEII
jgi:hypothetical protein